MATKVVRDLSEINAEVKKLSSEIAKSDKSTKDLNRSLKLDPSNATLLSNKMLVLQSAITNANAKLQLLRQAQKKMREEVAQGKASEEEYQRLAIEIGKTEAKVKSLNVELKKTNSSKLDKVEDGLKKVGRAATAIIGSVVALEVAFAKNGDAISKASDKYNISAESFQKYSYIFDRTTGNADNFTNALKTMQTSLGQVEKGSTKAINAFQTMGISIDELKGKSAAEALEMVMSALSKIPDETERANKAAVLFGDAGANIALVCGLTTEELQGLNEELEANGIMTQEQADKAAELNDKFTNLKNQFKEVGAQLAESLIPLMEALVAIASSVGPVIAGLADFFSQMGEPLQRVVAILLVVLAALPKLITTIKGVDSVLKILNTNPVTLKIMAIATAVILVMELLKALANWLNKIFGKKYDLEVNTNGIESNIDEASSANQATDQMASSSQNTSVVNYYDYSTQNNTIDNQMNIDDVAEQLTAKIRVGGR